MTPRSAGVVGSVVLHLALFAPLVRCAAPAAPPPPPPVANGDVGASLHGLDGTGNVHCGGYTYRGAGIHLTPWNGRVVDVGPGTPAEAAGLLEGDLILNSDVLGVDRYDVATVVMLQVQRGATVLRLPIVIGPVCSE